MEVLERFKNEFVEQIEVCNTLNVKHTKDINVAQNQQHNILTLLNVEFSKSDIIWDTDDFTAGSQVQFLYV